MNSRRGKGARDRNTVWKNNDRKFPKPGEGKIHASGGPDKDEHKGAYYKTHHD